MPNPSVVLATAGYDHTVRFWEATRGICYRTLQYADSQVNKLEITPDKRYLAAAGNPHIRLFEVTCAALHPNGVELYVPWAFPNPTTVYEPSLSTRPSLKGSALHTAHMHCFISQLVTVQTDYPSLLSVHRPTWHDTQ